MRTRQKLAEGKTKIIWEGNQPDQVIIQSKDDLTAGDGAKHDTFPGKARLATLTTAHVFRLLLQSGIPVAFLEQIDDTQFVAQRCEMIPLEIVVRREAHGSCLKRFPHLSKGYIFPQLVAEAFLKTSGKRWMGHALPKDDPLIVIEEDGDAELYLPDAPLRDQQPFLTLSDFPLSDDRDKLKQMVAIAKQTFLVLEKAWQLLDRRLVDFKVEFGINGFGQLLLADVIDNDSWRVVEDDQYIDKQVYRDGGDLEIVAAKYAHVAELTSQFRIPRQQIVLWRASPDDDLSAFKQAMQAHGAHGYEIAEFICSLHKQPIRAIAELTDMIQRVPDAVVLAFVGRSNGAGPTLSTHTMVPVITVPATWKQFPDDVWSSLRTPSQTPVSTILEPSNAVLHALQILAMRNPSLYAQLRMKFEERWVNILMM